MDNSPYWSRKFVMTHVGYLFLTLLPIAYHKIGIADQVTLLVIGGITGLGLGYNGANVLAKKYSKDDQGD